MAETFEVGVRAVRLLNAGRMVTRRYAVAALAVCEDVDAVLPCEPTWYEDDLRQLRGPVRGRVRTRVYVA